MRLNLADTDTEKALTPLQAASCTDRIALGQRAGQKVLSVRTVLSWLRNQVDSRQANPTPSPRRRAL